MSELPPIIKQRQHHHHRRKSSFSVFKTTRNSSIESQDSQKLILNINASKFIRDSRRLSTGMTFNTNQAAAAAEFTT